jgi:hypothetical protein
VGTVNEKVIEELFRHLVLTRLQRGERLSEEFRDNLYRTPPEAGQLRRLFLTPAPLRG